MSDIADEHVSHLADAGQPAETVGEVSLDKPNASQESHKEANISGDDLFGDNSDEEDEEHDDGDVSSDASERPATSSRPTGLGMSDDEEQQMYNRKFYGDDLGDGSQHSDEEEAEVKEADVDIIRHVVPYYTTSKVVNGELYYAKVPQFLTIDPLPFDPPSLKSQVEERLSRYSSKEEQFDDRLIDENTIRWRYSRGNNQQVFKESNAQVIKWSDGTFSLKLGDEYTDILVNDVDNTYITVSHEQQELMQCVEGGEIKKSMMLIPTSTNSKIHQRLSKAVARREARMQEGPSTYIVRMDPELEKKELEKKHDQVLRERRKRQLREQVERENAEGDGLDTGSFGFKRSSSKLSSEVYGREAKDEYDDEDGFIDDDEEIMSDDFEGEHNLASSASDDEDDLNAERLNQLKREGAARYREETATSNTAGDEETGSEETTIQKRRKVAVIDSDEE